MNPRRRQPRALGSKSKANRLAPDRKHGVFLPPPGGETDMQLSMPNLPEALAYSVVSAFALTVLAALVTAATGPWDLVAAVLVLAIAGGIYWLIGRQPATIVTAKQAAATGAILLALCGLADLATVYPYQGILFLFAAAALAVAFVLLQQGTVPLEMRLGGVTAFAGQSGVVQLRMLEELRDAGILTPEEFAAKRVLITL
jgi:hypothetical protein